MVMVTGTSPPVAVADRAPGTTGHPGHRAAGPSRGVTPVPEQLTTASDAATDPGPAYVLESVTKRYGRQRRHSTVPAALTDVTLTIPRGRTTVVAGPSGSGRTTLLRLLNRTIEPTEGTITVDELPLRRHRRGALRRRIGAVLQGSGLLPRRTVGENLTAAARDAGVPGREVEDRVDHWLAQVGLPPAITDVLPGRLTSGHLQRVKLTRALVADPEVLLLDEPFALLDTGVRGELQTLLLDLQQQRPRTIVLATQDLDEAIRLADRIAVLGRTGRLAQHATPAEVVNAPADDEVAAFVAQDRGSRALAFHPSDQLPVDRVRAVRTPSAVRHGGEALVLDARARPRGWVTPERPGQVLGLGGTFDPRRDSLRTALDAALGSPVGRAVTVEADTGRFTGAVRLEAITAHIAELRRTVAIGVLDAAEAERRRRAEEARREAAERARRQQAEQARLLAEIEGSSPPPRPGSGSVPEPPTDDDAPAPSTPFAGQPGA